MNKKLKTLIHIPASKKFFKVSISILMSALILLLSLTPFLPKFNYTPFKAFAVEIIPSKTYKITYDLPHLSKGITAKQREKAENNLSKTFRIPLSSLKQNEYLSKPLVYITYIPLLKKYEGFVKIGNIISKFDKIRALQEGTPTQNTKASNSDSNNQSDILLTGYFTLNNIPLRANIFIMNNGSVLGYSSMTIQDQNDNVLAMFTYGKALSTNKTVNTVPHTNSGAEEQNLDATNATEIVLRSYVKDITIGDPFGNGYKTVHGLRTDAMEDSPFNTQNNVDNMISIRSWGFRKPIEDAYQGFYSDEYPGNSIYVDVTVSNIDNVLETEYQSKALELDQYRFPSSSFYTTAPINVSFSYYGVGISYTINVPVGGVKREWSYKQTYGSISGFNNYAELKVDPYYYNDWSDGKIFWPDYDNNPYIFKPGSSYGGFYARQFFKNEAYGSGFYARFTSSYTYCVKVSMAFNGTDYYFISVYNTFDNVRLDQ